MSHSLTPVQSTATHQWSHSDYHLRDGDLTHIQRLSRQETSDGLGQVKCMIELLKTALYAHFNQPLPEQPLSLWQVFQSLKMERAYV